MTIAGWRRCIDRHPLRLLAAASQRDETAVKSDRRWACKVLAKLLTEGLIASQIASASVASFFWRLTYGFT
jgi:hypothetical protein